MMISMKNDTQYDMLFVYNNNINVSIQPGATQKHFDNPDDIKNVQVNGGIYTLQSGSFTNGDEYKGTLATDPNVITFADTTSPTTPPVKFAETDSKRK